MLNGPTTTNHNRRWLTAGAVAVLAVLPLIWSGPGNDLDVANVFRSGRAIARHGRYLPSRAPGAPVHETLVGLADVVGGPVLVNVVSLVAAAALLYGLDRLLHREAAGPGARWAVALVAVNPWFVIAATSASDQVLALALVVASVLALRSDRPVIAGVLGALAMGTRVGSITLLAAALVAELAMPTRRVRSTPGSGPDGEVVTGGFEWRRVAVAAGVAMAWTVALFVPSMVTAGGLAFARNDFSTSSPLVQLGRAGVKDLTLLGVVGSLLAVAMLPSVVSALRRCADRCADRCTDQTSTAWLNRGEAEVNPTRQQRGVHPSDRVLRSGSTRWLMWFSVVGLASSQVLFVRFPWKLTHLLPTLLCLAVVLAVTFGHQARPTLLMALVASQLIYGVVQIDVLSPDRAGQAAGATVAPGVSWGPVVTDWRCRRDHPDAWRGRQKVEVEAAWICSQPFTND